MKAYRPAFPAHAFSIYSIQTVLISDSIFKSRLNTFYLLRFLLNTHPTCCQRWQIMTVWRYKFDYYYFYYSMCRRSSNRAANSNKTSAPHRHTHWEVPDPTPSRNPGTDWLFRLSVSRVAVVVSQWRWTETSQSGVTATSPAWVLVATTVSTLARIKLRTLSH